LVVEGRGVFALVFEEPGGGAPVLLAFAEDGDEWLEEGEFLGAFDGGSERLVAGDGLADGAGGDGQISGSQSARETDGK